MSLAEEVPDLRDRSFSSLFSHALRGVPCRVLGLDGGPTELPVHEWTRAADPHDDALLAECVGDTLDVGCGPGRLAQRLAEGRRRRVLGIDVKWSNPGEGEGLLVENGVIHAVDMTGRKRTIEVVQP